VPVGLQDNLLCHFGGTLVRWFAILEIPVLVALSTAEKARQGQLRRGGALNDHAYIANSSAAKSENMFCSLAPVTKRNSASAKNSPSICAPMLMA
jgi:hypothetical protein